MVGNHIVNEAECKKNVLAWIIFKWFSQFLPILVFRTTCLFKTPRQYKPGARYDMWSQHSN